MNNNEACAEYFRGNSAYRRCFSEFEKKWKTYGKVTGIITLKNTSEEERRAIGGILGKTFYENTIRFLLRNLKRDCNTQNLLLWILNKYWKHISAEKC